MENTIAQFMVALGFDEAAAAKLLGRTKQTVADAERAVVEADKRIEAAKAASAKTQDQRDALTRQRELRDAQDALAAAKKREATEKEQAQKRAERVKEFVAGVEKMALAAAAAGTAITYAVGRVTGAFDNLHFVAQRTGASVQGIKALQYAFQQTGGSAEQATALIERYAKAIRTNEGVKGFVMSLGVDMKKPAEEQVLDTFRKLKDRPYGEGFRGAELAGITEEDYKLLTQYIDQLDRFRDEYKDTAKRFGLNSEDAAKASASFQRALTRLQATAGVLTDKLMASLAPAIQGLIDRFQAWVDANPGVLDKILNDIAKAAIYVAEAIGRMMAQMAGDDGKEALKRWNAFVDRAERFAKTVERIVYGVEKLLKFLNLISGTKSVLSDNDRTVAALNAISGGTAAPNGPGGINSGGADPAVPPKDDRTWWQRLAPKAWGGKDAPGGTPSGSAAGSLTALIDAEAKKAGIDPRIMQGIRAGESHRRSDYDVKSDAREDSYGPFQLNRRGGLGAQFEKETKLDLHDPKTIPDQVRWVAEHIKKRQAADPNYNPGSEWFGYKGLQDANPKWGDSGYAPSRAAGDVPAVAGAGGVEQRQGESGETRRQRISDDLARQLAAAGREAGVSAEVYSGGQPSEGVEGIDRTGSHRHDHGNAADLRMYVTGPDGKKRYLDMRNAADRPLMEAFLRGAVKHGATGIGAGPGYMGGSTNVHVGGGPVAAWGAGGRSSAAPDWVRRALDMGMRDRAEMARRPREAAPASGASRRPEVLADPNDERRKAAPDLKHEPTAFERWLARREAERADKAASPQVPPHTDKVPRDPLATPHAVPRMLDPKRPGASPGGFDMNKIDPKAIMRPVAPMGASPITNNSSVDHRAVHQTFHMKTNIHEARNVREAGRVMEGSFGNMHSLALANAQSAIT